MKRFTAAAAAALALAPISAPRAQDQTAEQTAADTARQRDEIVVHGTVVPDAAPAVVESITAAEIADTVNAVNTEDALKYLPSILVRKRHIGDVQAPMSTRTSGVGSSARSLIYADGLLLSALIGNNNSTASPRWSMVAPEEIARIDVMYGPFSAAYAGNSMGAVVNITTRMPEAFEASVKAEAVWQSFSQYGTDDTYPAQEISALVGGREGRFAWWLSVNHLNAHSQPLAYVTVARAAAVSAAGTAVTGAFADVNRTAAPIFVLGAGGLEHQQQDNVKLKLAYDITDVLRATYTLGFFHHDDAAGARSYLRDGQGNPVYAGALNIGGAAVTVPASAFSNNVYALSEDHFMHGLSLVSDSGGAWDFEAVASLYDYATDLQRLPSGALPAAQTGGPGSLVDMAGTGWYTLDGKAIWRPTQTQQITAGLHHDRYKLANNRTAVAAWPTSDGRGDPLSASALGKTAATAVWLEDAWAFAPGFSLTLGGRYESWRAYDGRNFSLAPPLAVAQPAVHADRFSPKATLAWSDSDWRLSARFGAAYRFPTVSELYQAVTTGATLTVPNPNLKPERALSSELSAERRFAGTKFRVSLFQENLANALVSQTAPLVPGSSTLFSYVQNIDEARARGIEVVADADDVFIEGLSLSGNATYVDARILSNPAFPASVGKHTPQVPAWRASVVATYRIAPQWTASLGGRYSSRVFATIDNSDGVTHTFQGFDPYVVLDARLRFALNSHWSTALGVDNLTDRRYFIFHPFPGRTVNLEAKYTY